MSYLSNTKAESSTVMSADSKGEMMVDLRSSKSSNCNSNLNMLAIPVVEEFVVSTSIEIDLSSQKTRESDTHNGP
jgi:hypothetical protein